MSNKVQTLVIPFFKVDIEILNDSKVKMLRKMPAGDTLFVLWIGLLSLAMKADDPGAVELGRGIPFSDDMLAAELDIEIQTVRMGIETFKKLRMIEVFGNGVIFVSNFEKHQALDKIRSNREATRKRVSDHRERKKLLLEDNSNSYNDDCNGIVTNHVTPEPENCNGTEKNRIELNRIDINREKSADAPKISPSPIKKVNNFKPGGKTKADKPKFVAGGTKQPDIKPDSLSAQIDATIDHWNKSDKLPRCRFNTLTMPDIAAINNIFNAYGSKDIKAAIDNFVKYFDKENFTPSSFSRFIVGSLDRWVDDCKPWDRYEDKTEPAIDPSLSPLEKDLLKYTKIRDEFREDFGPDEDIMKDAEAKVIELSGLLKIEKETLNV